MMLLASLSVLAGATVRMIFGPILALGLILIAARTWTSSRLDTWLTGGYLALVVMYVLAVTVAVSGAWNGVVASAFGF